MNKFIISTRSSKMTRRFFLGRLCWRTYCVTGTMLYLPKSQTHTFPASTTATTWTPDPCWPADLEGKPTWEIPGMVSSLVERDTICLWTRLCDVMPGHHHVTVTGQVNREDDREPRTLISTLSQVLLNFLLCIVISPYYYTFYLSFLYLKVQVS